MSRRRSAAEATSYALALMGERLSSDLLGRHPHGEPEDDAWIRPKDSDRLLAEDPATARRLCEAWEAVKTVAAKGADPAEPLELARPVEEFFGTVTISDAQVESFSAMLAANADVRWTFVLMHAPAWPSSNGDPDPGTFVHIEEALADRDYTERHGRDDITSDGPKIANLLLNGILDKHGPVEGDHTVEFGMSRPR